MTCSKMNRATTVRNPAAPLGKRNAVHASNNQPSITKKPRVNPEPLVNA
jgi:hypothetical protein